MARKRKIPCETGWILEKANLNLTSEELIATI